jgi:radical SAM protein with 4Fe4S-binding SPASM domain
VTYSPLRHLGSALWKRNPIQLTYFVTRRCNARCSFCFYAPAGRGEAPELSLEETERVSSSLGKLLWLAFSGGEIFLRRDIADLARVFYRHNRPALILLPTNGLLTNTIREQTEAILKSCPESAVVVKLSLDGTREVHDSLRGVPGAFDRTLETYHALRELLPRYANFELGVNTVFCSANQDIVGEVIDLVGELDDVRTHTVSLIRGEVPDPSLKGPDREKYRRVSEKMRSMVRRKPARRYRFRGGKLKVAQDILQRRLIYETDRQNRRLIPCYAGKLTLVLDEKGDVYPCEILGEPMGNVRESGYDLRKIMRGDRGRKMAAAIAEGNCHCTHECYFIMNILFNPRLYPALFREYARLALRSG